LRPVQGKERNKMKVNFLIRRERDRVNVQRIIIMRNIISKYLKDYILEKLHTIIKSQAIQKFISNTINFIYVFYTFRSINN